jgi:hypothetical protein
MSRIEAAFMATITREPELKTSSASESYMRFNCRVGDGESATWVQVTCFGDHAEALAGNVPGLRAAHPGEMDRPRRRREAGLAVAAWRCESPAIGRNKPRKDAPRPARPAQQDGPPEGFFMTRSA